MPDSNFLNRLAKRLAKEAEAEGRTLPPFRPITGKLPAHRLRVKIPRAPRKRGRPRERHPNEPMTKFIMVMTRREKARWHRAARDLGLSLAALMRLAMRSLMSSKQMQQLIALGPREIEARKRVQALTLGRRVAKVVGTFDHGLPNYDDPAEEEKRRKARLTARLRRRQQHEEDEELTHADDTTRTSNAKRDGRPDGSAERRDRPTGHAGEDRSRGTPAREASRESATPVSAPKSQRGRLMIRPPLVHNARKP